MPTVLNNQQIADLLIAHGVRPLAICLSDASYTLPSMDWLLGDFWKWYCADLAQAGLDVWAEDWDCDDFADDFAHAARKAHKQRQRWQKKFFAESTSVHLIQTQLTQPTLTGSHAFILVTQLNDAQDALILRAIEPQPQAAWRFYDLSPAEFAAVTLIR